MGVLKEWLCLAHGDFEAIVKGDEIPECPMGCDTVVRAFRTPPGFHSDRTKNIDSTVRNLAAQHGMTDISNRGGRAAKRQDPMQASRDAEYRKFLHDRYGDGWGTVPEGGTLNVQTQKITGSGAGAPGVLAQYHAESANVVADVKDALVPKPILIRKDHENLQLKDARPPA